MSATDAARSAPQSPQPSSNGAPRTPLRFEPAELEVEMPGPYDFPPIACLLEQLMGPAFATLRARVGYYPSDDDGDPVVGFTHVGRTCPQVGCDQGFLWVHPDGRIVAVVEERALGRRDHRIAVDVYMNDPTLQSSPPASVARFLESILRGADKDEWLDTHWHVAPEPRRIDATCWNDAMAQKTQRYRAALNGEACDPTYCAFEEPRAVAPGADGKAHFFDAPSTDRMRDAYVVRGDLVRVAYRRWEQEQTARPFVCAEFIALDGHRTVGWMRARDLASLELLFDGDGLPSSRTMHSLFEDSTATPRWWGAKAQAFGALRVGGMSGTGARLSVGRNIAGHFCSVSGFFGRTGPRMLATDSDDDRGCKARAALFNNGISLWAASECGGARANCSDVYLPDPVTAQRRAKPRPRARAAGR